MKSVDSKFDDFIDANQWLESVKNDKGLIVQFPQGNKSTYVRIKNPNGTNWLEYLWHHHQDGKTLILVEHDVHNSVQHTGGGSTISIGLKGIFSGPIF